MQLGQQGSYTTALLCDCLSREAFQLHVPDVPDLVSQHSPGEVQPGPEGLVFPISWEEPIRHASAAGHGLLEASALMAC